MAYDKYDDYDEEDKEPEETKKKANYLCINFKCCSTYGRIYKNKTGTAYIGRCPRCLRTIQIPIGEGGTNQRFFNAY